MSNSTSLLDELSVSQLSKEATINAALDAMSQGAIFGRRASTTTGVTWGYHGGMFRRGDGTLVAVANGTLTLTDAATNYLEVSGDGTVSANTTGFTAGRLPLYSVTVSGGAVTAYTDYRTGAQGVFRAGRHIVTLAYAASLTVDWALGYDVVRVTLTGNLALSFTNGGDGQLLMLELTQGGAGGHSVTLPGDVRYSTDLPSFAPTATAGAMDRLGFSRSASGSPQTYDLIAVNKGF